MMVLRWIVSVGAFAVATAVLGHHGFTGRYDTDKPVWLTGTVTAASFSPPHAVLAVQISPTLPPSMVMPSEITGPLIAPLEDSGQIRQIEFPPVGDFFQLSDKVRIGDRVEVIALRNCRPPHQLRSQWIRIADGSVTQRVGRLSYMARGCAAN
ncbi:MAG: hypothetical protein ACRCWF_07700 [Beijerinckiaceae bacterium]